jgi:hypothetical protein
VQTITSTRFNFFGQIVTNFTYQWFKNGNIILNATNSFIEIKNATKEHVADYSVVASEGSNVVVYNYPLAIDTSRPKLTLRRRLKNLEGDIGHAIEVIARYESTYTIESSSDLQNWVVWQSGTMPKDRISAEYNIESSEAQPKFYRALSAP